VFLQLVLFSALAAFTRDFDITAGFMGDDDQGLNQLLSELGDDENTFKAIQFREDRLPRLNARGVAMTMALSRLLLLVQYAVGRSLSLVICDDFSYLFSQFSTVHTVHII